MRRLDKRLLGAIQKRADSLNGSWSAKYYCWKGGGPFGTALEARYFADGSKSSTMEDVGFSTNINNEEVKMKIYTGDLQDIQQYFTEQLDGCDLVLTVV